MSSAPHNPDRTEERLDRLERDVGQIRIDLAALKARLDVEFPALRRELSHFATKAELAELRADMARNFRRMQAWMIGTTVTLIGAMAAITATAVAVPRYAA